MLLKSKFLRKKAYGYDISGEVMEGTGSIAEQENNQARNQDHSAMPWMHNETPTNPANNLIDADAEAEFPTLLEKKQPNWPPRT